MYLRHFGLRDKPFKLAHDPAYYYSAGHQVPLDELCYSIEEHQGLALLLGEPGTGKTTLLRRLLQSFGPGQRGVFVSDPAVIGASLVSPLAKALGAATLGVETPPAVALGELLTRSTLDVIVFIIDEAQGLAPRQLEEVRYLTNLEVPGRKLLEIILAGQPSLERLLAAPELAPLHQRVAVRCRLEAMDLHHTRAYIEHRLRVAGAAEPPVFTLDAMRTVYQHSRGVPRLVNIVCERSLVVGYVEEMQHIDSATVEDAVADLRLPEQQPDAPQPARTVSDDLLIHIASRIEAIEEKLDRLARRLDESGVKPPPSDVTEGASRWLQSVARRSPDRPEHEDPDPTKEGRERDYQRRKR